MSDGLVPFPFAKTVLKLSNDTRVEWMFGVLTGLPTARQKRLIMEARQPEVGIIDDQQAALLIAALGLTNE